MTNSRPLFTVLIPTRNRADVLCWALKTVTQQDFDSLEILVSDNSSESDVRSVVDDSRDPRVRYIRTPSRMGMTEHWNWAIDQVRGEWLTVVGDDDGLTPRALEVLHRILSGDAKLEHLTSARAVYVWPGVLDDGAPLLKVPILRRRVRARDLDRQFRSALRGETTWRELPMIYTGGWVRMDALNRIRDRDGILLRAMCPDIYSGAALSGTLKSAAVVDEVLAITGTSAHSNGLAHLRGDAVGPHSPGYAFSRETSLRVHPTLCATSEQDVPISDYALLLDAWMHAGHLHRAGSIDWKTIVAALLDSALLLSRIEFRNREFARARRIAKANGVEWESILHSAMNRRRNYLLSPQTALRQWTQLAATAEVREPQMDLRNVFVASHAVASVPLNASSFLKRSVRATKFAGSRLVPRLKGLLRGGQE
jgi:glycosyltransferase involved in cell wall biosynthesis